MTVKGKRAQTIRKMDHAEAQTHFLGGAVDESMPMAEVIAALKPVAELVDAAAFEDFFGRLLGRYRMDTDIRREQPSIAQELALVREAQECIEQVRRRLEYLPQTADAYINDACWTRHGTVYGNFRDGLDTYLRHAYQLLMITGGDLSKHSGKPGRNTASDRDWLLYRVAVYFQSRGAGKELAAGTAAAVLRTVGIEAPDDPRESRRLVRAIETLAKSGRGTIARNSV